MGQSHCLSHWLGPRRYTAGPAWHEPGYLDIDQAARSTQLRPWGNWLRILTPCKTVSQGSTRTGLCFAEAALLVRRRVILNVICARTGAEEVCYGPSPGAPQAPEHPSAHNALVCGRQMEDGQGPNQQGRPTSTGAGPGPLRNIPTNMTNTARARVTCGVAIHQPSPSRADR